VVLTRDRNSVKFSKLPLLGSIQRQKFSGWGRNDVAAGSLGAARDQGCGAGSTDFVEPAM
jgi:hypothetical protein